MLTLKEKCILEYITDHCKRIEEKAASATRETLNVDKDFEEIICFNLLQIGELAKSLEPDFIARFPGVPWRDIKKMRDRVAHGYGTIDLDIVWNTVSQDVKPLREYCEEIINNN